MICAVVFSSSDLGSRYSSGTVEVPARRIAHKEIVLAHCGARHAKISITTAILKRLGECV